MFENMTYEAILDRCLSRGAADIDKREGAIFSDSVASASAEIAIIYSEMADIMDRASPDTAEDVDLDNLVKQRGIYRLKATHAVRKGVFSGSSGLMDIPLGSRFSGGSVNYKATGKIETGIYQMTAEETGEIGNEYSGNLIPITYISGLTAATLTDVLIPGENEENDETLRARYFASLDSQSFGGNVADYKSRVNLMPGVGDCKVYPAWNGGGTVKVAIVASDYTEPSETLVETVQTALDPVQNHGDGVGIAPIGHIVTVVGVSGVPINVAFTLTLDTGITYADIKSAVESAIDGYLRGLVESWGSVENIIVRTAQIEAKVLDVFGVLDISGTTINGSASNLSLGADEIPTIGTVSNV